MTPSNDERKIQELLQHVAAEMPPTPDLMPRVRDQLRTKPVAPRLPVRLVPVIVVALLLALFLLILRPLVGARLNLGIGPTPTPLSQGDGNGPPCNLPKGTTFSVQVLDAYADPSRTSVEYRVI